jgi:hypothetical protein
MGPAPEGSSKADAQNHALLPLALRAFPSPALSDGSLDSPTLQRTLASASTPAPWTPYSAYPEASAIMPAEPGAARQTTIMTPQSEQPISYTSDMNLIVGGALAPMSDTMPQRPVSKAGPGLRLPSFEAMGIASPHPDNISLPCSDNAAAGLARERILGLTLRSRSDPGRVEGTALLTPDVGSASDLPQSPSPKSSSHPQPTPLHQYVHTLTPPAETGEPSWRPSIMTAVMDSPDTEPGMPVSQAEAGDQSVQAASGAMQSVTISAPAISGERSWLEEAVQAIRQFRSTHVWRKLLTTE